jgi:putative iron-only hydrogenase system regulator
MEKKIGTISILITDRDVITDVNKLLSSFADLIVARQGIPLREDGLFVISLIAKGDADIINTLTGKLGRMKGLTVKLTLIKIK